MSDSMIVAGVDVGTECVKAVILDSAGMIRGRAVVPMRESFAKSASAALNAACSEARVAPDSLAHVCGTGFGAEHVPHLSMTVNETTCHARAAFEELGTPVTVIDIGARDPRVIEVAQGGQRGVVRAARRCAIGISLFLDHAARLLDIHPTRFEELAATSDASVAVSSYCTVFGTTEVMERLRDGASREAIARGCIHAIVERICEIGGFAVPVVISGGVIEYFPSILAMFSARANVSAVPLPEPILAGARGAAWIALAGPSSSKETGA